MKRMLSFLTISLIIASAMSCKPRIDASNVVDIIDVEDMPIDTSRNLTLTSPSNSYYERFIERWDDITGATINLGINEMSGDRKDGRIWMVGVQAVRPGEPVVINPKVYGKGTSSIGFNWFNGQIKVLIVKYNINQPMPLIAPLGKALVEVDLFPNDPAVVYNDGKNSSYVTLVYGHMLKNSANKNGAGALYKASAWSNIGFKSGDDVDLVVYMYTTQQSYKWYTDTVGTNPEKGIPKALQGVTLDHIIEVQRFPVTLE